MSFQFCVLIKKTGKIHVVGDPVANNCLLLMNRPYHVSQVYTAITCFSGEAKMHGKSGES